MIGSDNHECLTVRFLEFQSHSHGGVEVQNFGDHRSGVILVPRKVDASSLDPSSRYLMAKQEAAISLVKVYPGNQSVRPADPQTLLLLMFS